MADLQHIKSKNQWKTSLSGRNVALHEEIGLWESNDCVRILPEVYKWPSLRMRSESDAENRRKCDQMLNVRVSIQQYTVDTGVGTGPADPAAAAGPII